MDLEAAVPPDAVDPPPDPTKILSEFAETDLSRHLALFYESTTSQLVTAAAFARYALQSRRRVLYLHDENSQADVEAAFRGAGIDVEARAADGDLVISDAETAYLDGEFDPERMIATLEREATAALDAGYDGLCVAGENTWCFHTDLSFDQVLSFEASFDDRAADLPVIALCQYRLDRFGGESIGKALWTHEQVVYRGHVCENPFYVLPERFHDSERSRSNGRLMLEQTYTLSQVKRDLNRREQRIDILSRTLRHNIRNDVNVVLGHLNAILEGDTLSDADRERIRVAYRNAEQIVETSKKARHVEGTLSDDDLEPIDLGRLAMRAACRAADRSSDAEISTSVMGTWTVLVDSSLGEAVDELLENALEHQDPGSSIATISVYDADGTVRLEVTNPGQPVPKSDRRALETGEETPLLHSQGLGLWMVKWIAERSNGRLRFPDADGECRIQIEFPKAAVVE
jgi:signal transduction histidine kinase